MGDVALPPWAADAADCVAQLAAALESPHVSARLHHWIDLVFGCARRGAAAERADNVFHYLTYDDMCAGVHALADWGPGGGTIARDSLCTSCIALCVWGAGAELQH